LKERSGKEARCCPLLAVSYGFAIATAKVSMAETGPDWAQASASKRSKRINKTWRQKWGEKNIYFSFIFDLTVTCAREIVSGFFFDRSAMEPPLKKQRKALLSDSSSDEESGDESGGVEVGDLKINEEYARRFEHNKKREELQKRMEGHTLSWFF
jgi:hypothetical protein